MNMLHKIKPSLFFLGLVLIALNVTGLFISLRNPDLYQEKHTEFKGDITLNEDDIYDLISRTNEPNDVYIEKLNDAINKGIAHYWRDEGIDKYHLRIPIYENYLLFLASYIYPRIYRKYEFYNHRKAIERGVGLCSQQAIIVSQILEEHSINSKMIGLSGHVVAMAEVDRENNNWWVLDPDYGVVIKHDISEIEKNPGIIRTYYLEKGHDVEIVDLLTKIYGQEGNVIMDGAMEYVNTKYYVEYLSYIGIWAIPAVLLFPYSASYFRKRHREK